MLLRTYREKRKVYFLVYLLVFSLSYLRCRYKSSLRNTPFILSPSVNANVHFPDSHVHTRICHISQRADANTLPPSVRRCLLIFSMTVRGDGRRVYFQPNVATPSHTGTCRLAGSSHYARVRADTCTHTVTWPVMHADGIRIQTSRAQPSACLPVDTHTHIELRRRRASVCEPHGASVHLQKTFRPILASGL